MAIEFGNYKETNIVGSMHTRCNKIMIFNPYKGNPTVIFSEEVAYVLGEGDEDFVLKDRGEISTQIDMEETISDEEGNTISYGELYKWMGIAYLKQAVARDELKEQSEKAEALRFKAEDYFNMFMEEFSETADYSELEFSDFYSAVVENEDITYQEICDMFKVV